MKRDSDFSINLILARKYYLLEPHLQEHIVKYRKRLHDGYLDLYNAILISKRSPHFNLDYHNESLVLLASKHTLRNDEFSKEFLKILAYIKLMINDSELDDSISQSHTSIVCEEDEHLVIVPKKPKTRLVNYRKNRA